MCLLTLRSAADTARPEHVGFITGRQIGQLSESISGMASEQTMAPKGNDESPGRNSKWRALSPLPVPVKSLSGYAHLIHSICVAQS